MYGYPIWGWRELPQLLRSLCGQKAPHLRATLMQNGHAKTFCSNCNREILVPLGTARWIVCKKRQCCRFDCPYCEKIITLEGIPKEMQAALEKAGVTQQVGLEYMCPTSSKPIFIPESDLIRGNDAIRFHCPACDYVHM